MAIFGTDEITMTMQEDSEVISVMGDALDKLGNSLQESISAISGSGGLNDSIKELAAVSLTAKDNITKLYEAIGKTPRVGGQTSNTSSFEGGFAKSLSKFDKSSEKLTKEANKIPEKQLANNIKGLSGIGLAAGAIGSKLFSDYIINPADNAVGAADRIKSNMGFAGAAGGAAVGAAVGSIVPVIGTAIGAAVGGVAGGLGLGLAGKNSSQQQLTSKLYGGEGFVQRNLENKDLAAIRYTGNLTTSDQRGFAESLGGGLLTSRRNNLLGDANLSSVQEAQVLAKISSSQRFTNISAQDMAKTINDTGMSLEQYGDISQQLSRTSAYRVDGNDTINRYAQISKDNPLAAQGFVDYENKGFIGKATTNAMSEAIFGASYEDSIDMSPEDKMAKIESFTGMKGKDALDLMKDVAPQDKALQSLTDTASPDANKEDTTKLAEKLAEQSELIQKQTDALNANTKALKFKSDMDKKMTRVF